MPAHRPSHLRRQTLLLSKIDRKRGTHSKSVGDPQERAKAVQITTCPSTRKHARCQKMGFEVQVEQELGVRIYLNQNGRDAKGVRRCVAQDIYSVVLLMRGLADGQGAQRRWYCITREDE